MSKYAIQFYTESGDRADRVEGLTIEEVDVIYTGIKTILKDHGVNNCCMAYMPTVWNEDTQERELGY